MRVSDTVCICIISTIDMIVIAEVGSTSLTRPGNSKGTLFAGATGISAKYDVLTSGINTSSSTYMVSTISNSMNVITGKATHLRIYPSAGSVAAGARLLVRGLV